MIVVMGLQQVPERLVVKDFYTKKWTPTENKILDASTTKFTSFLVNKPNLSPYHTMD